MGKVILRFVIFVVFLFAAAYFLCEIKPATEYGWLSAIWHGLFFFPNLFLHWLDKDILFYSELPTTAYSIFFVVGVVLDSLIVDFIKIVTEVLNNTQR